MREVGREGQCTDSNLCSHIRLMFKMCVGVSGISLIKQNISALTTPTTAYDEAAMVVAKFVCLMVSRRTRGKSIG